MLKYLMISVFLIGGLSSCSKSDPEPTKFVKSYEVSTSEKKPAVGPDRTSSRSVHVKAVLDKKAILNQEYFYVANLQYSSIYDKKNDLYSQSSASGLTPVHFRIVGNELDLIADNKNQYPSDVNHPELLISRFKIIEETESSLTISEANSDHYLASDLVSSGGATGVPSPEDHWVRSFEFVSGDLSSGQYLLQESSVLLATGEVGEFLEAIFPKINVKASENFKVYQSSSEDSSQANDKLKRFRFLQSDRIFNGETKLTYAVHFDLPDDKSTIDWYVTPNISDEDIEPVGLAVEGWNRYFREFKGINRDVLVFKGRLPQGIHLGDPRFNVINWDNRLVAGAAYESQSFDPSNGKQINSIIYLPAAWIKIGMSYWAGGEFSEIGEAQIAAQSGASKQRSVCFRDLHEAAAFLASGKLKVGSEEGLKKFGLELLKQTLFHELGHALGLDHNFKGSLSYKPQDAKSQFSSSIMDYNDFEIERAAFDDLHKSTGPLLEYDRQALSTLYNSALDVAPSDPVLPACNDREADLEIGGVDPLCTRYDIEADPTQSIANAWSKISEVKLVKEVTLSEAIMQVPITILSAQVLSNVKTKSDLEQMTQKISASYDGVLNYYLSSGRSSLGYATKANMRALYKHNEKASLQGLEPRLMREKVYQGITQIVGLKTLPAVVHSALERSLEKTIESLKLSAFLSGITTTEAGQIVIEKQKSMSQHIEKFSKDEKLGLPAIRAKILTSMARHPAVPFFFGRYDKTQVDYEMMVVNILSDVGGAKERSSLERLAAIKSLASFTGRKLGDTAIEKLSTHITAERDAAEDNDGRDMTENLLKALSAGPPSPSNLK